MTECYEIRSNDSIPVDSNHDLRLQCLCWISSIVYFRRTIPSSFIFTGIVSSNADRLIGKNTFQGRFLRLVELHDGHPCHVIEKTIPIACWGWTIALSSHSNDPFGIFFESVSRKRSETAYFPIFIESNRSLVWFKPHINCLGISTCALIVRP